MISDKYITREEMLKIVELMGEANEFLRAEAGGPVSVLLFTDEMGLGTPRSVTDPNGETIGYIGLGEDINEVVFWLDNGEDAK